MAYRKHGTGTLKYKSYGEIQHTPIYGNDEYMGGIHNKGSVQPFTFSQAQLRDLLPAETRNGGLRDDV